MQRLKPGEVVFDGIAKWVAPPSEAPPPYKPNRKERRKLQTRMKQRVKKVIKSQELLNAKYRARVKAASSGDAGTAGIGEVEVGQVFL